MADNPISAFTELTSVDSSDLLAIVDDPAGTAVTKKITKANLVTAIPAGNITTGTLNDARIAASNVTQHEAALSITESQISDLGTYADASHTHTASEITDFDTEVANNSAVTANTAKVSYTDAAKVAGIEAGADVTDEANVTAALDGATLTAVTVAGTDKVLVQDASDADNLKTVTAQSIADLGGGLAETDIDTLAELNAIITDATLIDTTDARLSDARTPTAHTHTISEVTDISAFGATLIDDADAGTARTTLGVDAAGTDNSTDVTLAGEDYLSLSGQEITANAIDLDNLSATGTADSTTFLRGDNTWATPAGGGSGDVATDAIWDAKADLAVGTGANTAARLAVGTDGQVLTADSAEVTGLKWATIAGASNPAINEITDVTITTPADNEVLAYDNATSEWINQTAAEAGLATASHTHPASEITDFDTEVANNTEVAANTADRHNAVTVTDSAEINLTLTGQDITAAIVTGSIDESKLDTSVNASLDLADSASQPGHAHTALDITDFDTEVSNNASVAANTAKVSYPGSADATELNILDGATLTTTELNYVDGVTSAIQTQLDAKAADSDVVKLTGAQTVAGIKTFSSFAVTPSSAPTTDYEVANKKYVDDNAGGGGTAADMSGATFYDNTGGQSITTTDTVINLDTTLTNNSAGDIALAADEVTVNADGLYLVSYAMSTLYVTGTRQAVRIDLELDTGSGFALVPASFSGAYSRITTDITSTTSEVVLSLTSGDKLRMIGSVDTNSVETIAGGSRMSVIQLKGTKGDTGATGADGGILVRRGTVASSATPTINTDNVDLFSITALAVDITSMTTNLSGTPTHGQKLMIEITGTAARAITWGASFEASTTPLPTTTVSTDMLTVGFSYNSATSKWRCLAAA